MIFFSNFILSIELADGHWLVFDELINYKKLSQNHDYRKKYVSTQSLRLQIFVESCEEWYHRPVYENQDCICEIQEVSSRTVLSFPTFLELLLSEKTWMITVQSGKNVILLQIKKMEKSLRNSRKGICITNWNKF